ncbi:MAG: SUMF1/EgtB/PvdO family nonheme iron enzyme [Bacteroidetes bacterium]|nr:SUMF1/EgtB/PvdO family nonheme iron enzyme [Bacteroidota bacterium]
MKIKSVFQVCALAWVILMAGACKKENSRSTGWEYNNSKNGGFEKRQFTQQQTGPGLVFIEGGTFAMGNTQDDVMFEWNNSPRRVTVTSFYLDETEVRNLDYLEYLYWLDRVYSLNYPGVYRKALPDTLVWRQKLAYNEPLVEYYFRHPAYRDYPVVGVSWVQANDYCQWRTDRVNEMILIQRGILKMDPDQSNEKNFNTEAYLAGQYEGAIDRLLPDLNPKGKGTRNVKMEDGILLPQYRLPTEAEWEFASVGLIGNTHYERVVERKNYPWNGNYVRTNESRYYGSFMDNFKRGKGDYMGVAGNLNDGADIPAACGSYFPNDYGLYNMAGNVSEWVLDVYRPLNSYEVSDLRPFRGNVFKTPERDAEGFLAPKDSLGRMKYREITPSEALNRKNYRKADNINYMDGDFASNLDNWKETGADSIGSTNRMYDYSISSLITDHARVYKGGSWKDQAFYLSPGSRRFLGENETSDAIGFRCAMTRVGGSIPGK